MNKALSLAIAFGALGAGIAGAGLVSAHGLADRGENKSPEERQQHHQERLEEKAAVLGLTTQQLEEARENKTSLADLAALAGISEDELHAKMKELHSQRMKERLASAVEEGRLTQDEADEKLAQIEERIANGDHAGFHKKRGGRGHGFNKDGN